METLHDEQLVDETVKKSSFVDNNNLNDFLFEPILNVI